MCISIGGAVIIVLSFTLNSMLYLCLRGRGRETEYSKLEWSSNETLQLQRLAHEAAGTGTWSRGTGLVPITRHGDVLAVLDIDDLNHPRLRASPERQNGIRNEITYTEEEKGKVFVEDAESEKR